MRIKYPAWHGRVSVSFQTAGGSTSKNSLGVSYKAPTLDPLADSTYLPGQEILLSGIFGKNSSVGALFKRYKADWPDDGFIQFIFSSPSSSPPSESLTQNNIWISYRADGVNKSKAACVPSSWDASGSSVSCKLPGPRVPGSDNILELCNSVSIRSNGTLITEDLCSDPMPLKYQSVSLESCNITSSGPRLPMGGWILSITNTSTCPLYSLEPPSSALEWQLAALISSPDPSRGRVGGGGSLLISRRDERDVQLIKSGSKLLKAGAEEVLIVMPPIIGRVSIELVYALNRSSPATQGDISLLHYLSVDYAGQNFSVAVSSGEPQPCELLQRVAMDFPCQQLNSSLMQLGFQPANASVTLTMLGSCSASELSGSALNLTAASEKCSVIPPSQNDLYLSSSRDEVSALALSTSLFERTIAQNGSMHFGDVSPLIGDVISALRGIRERGFCWPAYPLPRMHPLPWAASLSDSAESHNLMRRGSPYFDDTVNETNCMLASSPSPRRLTIFGRSLGREAGGADLSVAVSLVGIQNSSSYPCLHVIIDANNDSMLTCDVQEALPVNSYTVSITTRLGSLETAPIVAISSSSSARIRAVCPPNFFADNTTFGGAVMCRPCPSGALCAGGELQPRSAETFWETNIVEWKDERFIHLDDHGFNKSDPRFSFSVFSPENKDCAVANGWAPDKDASVAAFVSCAVPALCQPNGSCLAGADGWMCAYCKKDYARSFNGACVDCIRDISMTEGMVALFFALIALYVLLRLLYSLEAVRRRAQPLVGLVVALYSSAARVLCIPCARFSQPRNGTSPPQPATPFPSAMVMAKMLITYFQSLAAIQALIPADRAPPAPCAANDDLSCDRQFGPAFLAVVRQANDLGLGTAQLSCVLTKWSDTLALGPIAIAKGYFFVLLPIVVVGVGACIFLALTLQSRRRVHAPASGAVFVYNMRDNNSSRGTDSSSSQQSPSSAASGDASNAFGYWLAFLTVTVLSPSIGTAARLQSCESVSNGGYLIDDPAVSCCNPKFITLKDLAFAIGTAYLVLPLVLGFLSMLPVLQSPSSIDSDLPPAIFTLQLAAARLTQALPAYIPGFLTEAYKKRRAAVVSASAARALPLQAPPVPPSGWHPPHAWELISLFRKGLLMAVASGFTGLRLPTAKVVSTILILFVSTLLHLAVQPFADAIVNHLELAAFIAEIFFATAVLTRASPMAVAPRERNTFDLLAITVNGAFLLIVAAALLDRQAQGRLGWTEAWLARSKKKGTRGSEAGGTGSTTAGGEDPPPHTRLPGGAGGLQEYLGTAQQALRITQPAPRPALFKRSSQHFYVNTPRRPRDADDAVTHGRMTFEPAAT